MNKNILSRLVFAFVILAGSGSVVIAKDADVFSYYNSDANHFTYSGNWQGAPMVAGHYRGDRYSCEENASLKFKFIGAQVYYFGQKGPSKGVAEIKIDGAVAGEVDLYAAHQSDNNLIWSSPVLKTAGSHTLTLRVEGEKNRKASQACVSIQRFNVRKTKPTEVSTASTSNIPQAFVAYGDSISHGTGALPRSVGYVSLLAGKDPLTNRAIGGQFACDMADRQAFKNSTPSAAAAKKTNILMMVGSNDANIYDDSSYKAFYKNCHLAAGSWLAVPSSRKVVAQSSSCVKDGDWKVLTDLPSAEMTSSTKGDSMRCSIQTYGAPLYIWYRTSQAVSGKFTYQIDDQPVQTVNAKLNTPRENEFGEALIRETGVKGGLHKVRFNVVSDSGSNRQVTIFGVGTGLTASEKSNKRKLYIGGVLPQRDNARAAQTESFNDAAEANVNLLLKDNLPVKFVNVRAYLNGADGEMRDKVHPNNRGHSELHDAFKSQLKIDAP